MAASGLSRVSEHMVPMTGAEAENWYGLQTRPRHEKIVAQRLEERGVTTFLPLVTASMRIVFVVFSVKVCESFPKGGRESSGALNRFDFVSFHANRE